MTGTVGQLIAILDRLAPPHLAEGWDSVGLQVGHPDWPVTKVWTALDPLPEVVAEACRQGVDLLVTHHPLFFKPLQRVDAESPEGRVLTQALARRLSIFCAHTNLDQAVGGVNDILAARLGLHHLSPLTPVTSDEKVKLVVFVPHNHVKVVLEALYAVDAGRIGHYACCTFRGDGIGTFLPHGEARPAIGAPGLLNEVAESRLEVIVDRRALAEVVAAIRKVHPYETMAYDSYPLVGTEKAAGMGRVGELAEPVSFHDLAANLKKALKIPVVKTAGPADRPVQRVALCAGSGSSLWSAALAAGAQVYISGDLGYHTARQAQQAGLGLMDVGHFASEHPVVEGLAAYLGQAAAQAGLEIVVEPAPGESDPFTYR